MTLPAHRSPLPGLLVVAVLTAAAYGAARVPGVALLGPLVLALLFGVAGGAVPFARRHAPRLAPGVRFAGRTLLKVGIVLLGVRLDARALIELGPWVLAGSVLGVLASFAAIEVTGRALRVPTDLRRIVAIGTAVCGASAIAAALPVLRAREAHASVAIGAISLIGTVGVVAFAAWDALALAPAALVGALAGATLQEVGQVVAAGAAVGGAPGDLALLIKLSRVVLLAPVLVGLAWWGRATGVDAASAARRPFPIPPFVIGFVALGVLTSAGLLGPSVVALATTLGTLLTAAAMAGIGLGVDARSVGPAGRAALVLAVVGFAALIVVMGAYYAWVLG